MIRCPFCGGYFGLRWNPLKRQHEFTKTFHTHLALEQATHRFSKVRLWFWLQTDAKKQLRLAGILAGVS